MCTICVYIVYYMYTIYYVYYLLFIMSQVNSISFTNTSYSKMMLHIIKHLKKNCYGLLIGRVYPESYVIEDIIPISHSDITSPLIDISLKLCSISISNKENYRILGVYDNQIDNYNQENTYISLSSLVFVDSIRQLYGNDKENKQIIIKVSHSLEENNTFKEKVFDCPKFDIRLYVKGVDEGRISFVESKKHREYMKKMISNHRQEEIFDVEDHLNDDNGRLDYLNLGFNKEE